MLNQIFQNNDMNETGTLFKGLSPGRCSPTQQQGPGRDPATARVKWNKKVNKAVMECFYRSNHLIRKESLLGNTEREYLENGEKGECLNQQSNVHVTRQGQIRKNGWLQELELEAIKRQVEDKFRSELCREQDVTVDSETVETDVGAVEEETKDAEDSIVDTEGDLSEEQWAIIEQLKTIMERRTDNGITLKKVDEKVLKVQIDRVTEAIKYLKSKGITETNTLVRVASAWVAKWTGLKKAGHRMKNEPSWKCGIEGDIKRLRQEVNFLEREVKG